MRKQPVKIVRNKISELPNIRSYPKKDGCVGLKYKKDKSFNVTRKSEEITIVWVVDELLFPLLIKRFNQIERFKMNKYLVCRR